MYENDEKMTFFTKYVKIGVDSTHCCLGNIVTYSQYHYTHIHIIPPINEKNLKAIWNKNIFFICIVSLTSTKIQVAANMGGNIRMAIISIKRVRFLPFLVCDMLYDSTYWKQRQIFFLNLLIVSIGYKCANAWLWYLGKKFTTRWRSVIKPVLITDWMVWIWNIYFLKV